MVESSPITCAPVIYIGDPGLVSVSWLPPDLSLPIVAIFRVNQQMENPLPFSQSPQAMTFKYISKHIFEMKKVADLA